MGTAADILFESWNMFLQAAPYILFGTTVAGFLKVFLNPDTVARHLAGGRFMPVFKAALIGIPLPLCSCGVLPAATALKQQGANRGAITSFLISTPESSVDSIAVTWALLDPVITVARPLAAFVTAFAAGITVNFMGSAADEQLSAAGPGGSGPACSCGSCCSKSDAGGYSAQGLWGRFRQGMVHAVTDVWAEIAGWFFLGLFLAGVISVLVPQELMVRYLGGGIFSMLAVLAAGVPLYICASASTPVAAALVLSGASPGTALVLMLAGPATNITSLTVLLSILGRRVTVVYLLFIAIFSVAAGLLLDVIYEQSGISAAAVAGSAGSVLPGWFRMVCAVTVLAMSLPLAASWFRNVRPE